MDSALLRHVFDLAGTSENVSTASIPALLSARLSEFSPSPSSSSSDAMGATSTSTSSTTTSHSTSSTSEVTSGDGSSSLAAALSPESLSLPPPRSPLPSLSSLLSPPLNNNPLPISYPGPSDVQGGRLGPGVVAFDRATVYGLICFEGHSDLDLESRAFFSSARANVAVHKGSWAYEVIIGTGGLAQIGWTAAETGFTSERGVGDYPNSWAYDGHRQCKWAINPAKYGDHWAAGDVIGVALNIDEGRAEFYRNGASLGSAWLDMPRAAPDVAYFPALSLQANERVSVNFGAMPFKYPMPGYNPLQKPPPDEFLHRASYLVSCFERAVNMLASPPSPSATVAALAAREEVGFALAIIVGQLSPLLAASCYTTEAVLIPLFARLQAQAARDTLPLAAKLLNAYMEHSESKIVWPAVMRIISESVRIAPLTLSGDGGTADALNLVSRLLEEVEGIGIVWVTAPGWGATMERLFASKDVTRDDLKGIIPDIWHRLQDSSIDSTEDSAASDVEKLQDLFDKIAAARWRMLNAQLAHSSSLVRAEVSQWLRKLLTKNHGMLRSQRPPGLSDASVLSNLFWAIATHSDIWSSFNPKDWPIAIYHDGSLTYCADVTRLGGTMNHLTNNSPPVTSTPTLADLSTARALQVELFDFLVMCFHLGLANKLKHAARVFQLKASSQHKLMHAKESRDKVVQEVELHVRLANWHKVILSGDAKSNALYQFLTALSQVLNETGPSEDWHYLPQAYGEAFIDSIHAVRRSQEFSVRPAQAPRLHDGMHAEGLSSVITLLVERWHDSRMVNPDLRELFLSAISVLLQTSAFVRAFEGNPTAVANLLPELLTAFDGRFWIPINTILLRFWRGLGFAERRRDSHATDVASPVFQARFRELLASSPETAARFINRVLNYLNWAITEFTVTLGNIKEVISSRRSPPNQLVRKINVVYELSGNLLRMLEYMTIDVPDLFLSPPELSMARLAEMMTLVLSRTTRGPDSLPLKELLQWIATHRGSGLDKLGRGSFLAPIMGIVVALHTAEKNAAGEPGQSPLSLAKALITQPSFDMDTFVYLKGVEWGNLLVSDGIRKENLTDFIEDLQTRKDTAANAPEEEGDEDDLCTICYVHPVDTVFEPCGHSSCGVCIQRQLLNKPKCFFCNMEVTGTHLRGSSTPMPSPTSPPGVEAALSGDGPDTSLMATEEQFHTPRESGPSQ